MLYCYLVHEIIARVHKKFSFILTSSCAMMIMINDNIYVVVQKLQKKCVREEFDPYCPK